MKFSRSVKRVLSGTLVSSLLFGNVGYSVGNNNKNNLTKDYSKKNNDYIINSKDKQGLKKILVPTLTVGVPVALALTCWWLLSGSDDNENEQTSGSPSGSPERFYQSQGSSSSTQPSHAQSDFNSTPTPQPSQKADEEESPRGNQDDETDIATIIKESCKIFNKEQDYDIGANIGIANSYTMLENLGQIITRYFSLVMWSQDGQQVASFESGELSKWFIGAVNEYFITKHGHSDDSPQENTELIKNELTALYNEKDAQNVVKIACGIVAKIASKLIISRQNNPMLTESLIKYS